MLTTPHHTQVTWARLAGGTYALVSLAPRAESAVVVSTPILSAATPARSTGTLHRSALVHQAACQSVLNGAPCGPPASTPVTPQCCNLAGCWALWALGALLGCTAARHQHRQGCGPLRG